MVLTDGYEGMVMKEMRMPSKIMLNIFKLK